MIISKTICKMCTFNNTLKNRKETKINNIRHRRQFQYWRHTRVDQLLHVEWQQVLVTDDGGVTDCAILECLTEELAMSTWRHQKRRSRKRTSDVTDDNNVINVFSVDPLLTCIPPEQIQQYNTMQYDTIQYNTTQHTTQHNTTQHNTIIQYIPPEQINVHNSVAGRSAFHQLVMRSIGQL